MTKNEAKDLLVTVIEDSTGIKATVLITAEELDSIRSTKWNIPDLLDELVVENRICEIEFALPKSNQRLRSFYLPIGSGVYLKNCVDAAAKNG